MFQGVKHKHPPKSSWKAVINDCPPSANVFLRTHWAERKKQKEVWYLHVYTAFFYEGVTRASGKRKVKLTIFSKKERDQTNQYLAADKLILDNLKRLGWIVDDSPKWMDLELIGCVGEPQTIVEIHGEGEQE